MSRVVVVGGGASAARWPNVRRRGGQLSPSSLATDHQSLAMFPGILLAPVAAERVAEFLIDRN